jgi:hypothetical protein
LKKPPIKHSIDPITPQANTDQQAKDSAKELTPGCTEKLDLPKSPTCHCKSCHKWKERREWGIFGVQLLTLFAVVWYAAVNTKQLGHMKQSVDLTKKGLRATQAAICDVNVIMEAPPILTLTIVNKGAGVSETADGDFMITRRRLDHGELKDALGSPQYAKLHREQIGLNGDNAEKSLRVDGLDYDALQNMREAVIVDGTLVYDNGFDEIKREHICIQGTGDRASTGQYRGSPFAPCDTVPRLIRTWELQNEQLKSSHK